MINMVPVKCGKNLFFDFLVPGAQNSISGSSFWPLWSTTQYLSSLHWVYTPGTPSVQPMTSLSTPQGWVYSKRPWVVLGSVQVVHCWETWLYLKEAKQWIWKLIITSVKVSLSCSPCPLVCLASRTTYCKYDYKEYVILLTWSLLVWAPYPGTE